MLVTVAMAAGARMEEAKDAAQTTMMEIMQRGDQIEQPRAYARRAVISNFIKQRKRDILRLTKEVTDHQLSPPAEVDLQMTAWEDRQWVEQTLNALTPGQRDVLQAVIDGLATKEIAELLGKSEPNIRKHLQLARQHLRRHLNPDQGTDPAPATTGKEDTQ